MKFVGVTSALLLALVSHIQGYCQLRQTCLDKEGRNYYPCLFPGSPDTQYDSERILHRYCPEFLQGDTSPDYPQGRVCCGNEMMLTLRKKLDALGSKGLKRCPACDHNIGRLLCHIYCAPFQEEFIQVLNASKNSYSDHPSVTAMEIHLSKSYAEDMFESCKDIQDLVTRKSVVEEICSNYDDGECSPEALLNALYSIEIGEESQYNFPQTVFKLTEEKHVKDQGTNYAPLFRNQNATACHDPVGFYNERCSCRDCESACDRG